jgi:hypothetical protein
MTPDERLVARELRAMADIPVEAHDLARAHEELRSRLKAGPPARRQPTTRRHRTRLLAAATAAAAVVAVWAWGQRTHSVEPAGLPSRSDAAAIRTASSFVDAFASFDAGRSRDLLTPGAQISGATDRADWASTNSFFKAAGGRILPQRCVVTERASRTTTVSCPFDYQLLRSADLALGPYTGSYFVLTTRAGLITHVDMEYDYTIFHDQVWEPFAAWIDAYHRADGARMYPGWPAQDQWGPGNAASNRLWSERTREFVRYARHLCATPTGTYAALCTGIRHQG